MFIDKKLDYTPICMNDFDRNLPCRKYLFCLCFLFSCWPGRISELQFKHSFLHILWCILSTQDVHRFCSIAIRDFLSENSRLLLNVYILTPEFLCSCSSQNKHITIPSCCEMQQSQPRQWKHAIGSVPEKNIPCALKFSIAVYDFRKYSSGTVTFY